MLSSLINDLAVFLPPLMKGALYTIGLCALSSVLAVVIGLVVCVCKMSRLRLLSKVASGYIDLIRGTPLLLQLFYIYYALPDIGIILPAFLAGVLGLSINFGAYLAELFRSGIQSIDRGQTDAANAVGLSAWHRMRYVILPQALRNIYPGLANYGLVLIKDSSLVAVISVLELMRTGELLASSTFEAMKVYTLVALIYLAISYVVAKSFSFGEKALAVPGMWGQAAHQEERARRTELVEGVRVERG